MKIRIGLVLAGFAVFLSGCASAPQKPVQLSPNTLTSTAGRVGVVTKTLPAVDTHLPGASCLLCAAAASIANSSLTTHTRTLPYEDLPKLKNDVADLMRKKGMNVTVITEDLNVDELSNFTGKGPNIAKKDFSPLQKKYDIDKLVVIDIRMLGMLRPYSSYFPTSDPKAVLQGAGFIVNLRNNTYEWYLPVDITKSADKNWDEPPKFPGLTNAYFQTLELAKDKFLQPFIN